MAQQPTLTTDEALVLQQINEHGEDGVIGLEQSLRNNQWTITFKVKNLTNQRQMSEFNHPLPGINFSVKLRYLFR